VLAKVAIRASARDMAIDRTGLRIFPPLGDKSTGGRMGAESVEVPSA